MYVLKPLTILLISILGVSEGLKCHKCSSCEEGEVGDVEECAEGYNVCLKMSIAGVVHKSCSKEAACSISDTEDLLKDAWADITKNLPTDDQGNMTSQQPESQDCNIKCDWPNEPLYGVHASDCRKYIQCTASGPVEQNCLPGTHWDQEMLTCVHQDTKPCVAGCSKRGDVPEPRNKDVEKFANCCSEDYCNGADNKVAIIYTLIPILTLPILNYFL